ncbi:MAG TPA: hypothetical protein VFS20_00500 [Longimicrobium sp.]|nr:hypothetical protein [Longimicrobium sp.]
MRVRRPSTSIRQVRRVASRPRASVHSSDRLRTRSGCVSAISSATGPPSEWPTTCAESHPRCVISQSVSSAICRTVMAAPSGWLSPIPRLSKVRHWNSERSPRTCGVHPRPETPTPWISTTGAPLPSTW